MSVIADNAVSTLRRCLDKDAQKNRLRARYWDWHGRPREPFGVDHMALVDNFVDSKSGCPAARRTFTDVLYDGGSSAEELAIVRPGLVPVAGAQETDPVKMTPSWLKRWLCRGVINHCQLVCCVLDVLPGCGTADLLAGGTTFALND